MPTQVTYLRESKVFDSLTSHSHCKAEGQILKVFLVLELLKKQWHQQLLRVVAIWFSMAEGQRLIPGECVRKQQGSGACWTAGPWWFFRGSVVW